jgi:hypothetical protein
VNPQLLFLGTEYGVYVSLNQGDAWHKFSNGMPTISVRDLAIQKRENDLVVATFGRSYYILDDYSPLRAISDENLAKGAQLFPIENALQYVQERGGTSSQGASFYTAKNPTYGAQFTYYVADDTKTMKAKRKASEKKLKKDKKDIPFPGWEALDAEGFERKPQAILRVTATSGKVLTEISGEYTKGIHRKHWDLRERLASALDIHSSRDSGTGLRSDVTPGTYYVQLFKKHNGALLQLTQKEAFEVARLRQNVLTNPKAASHIAYKAKLNALYVKSEIMDKKLEKTKKKIAAISKAIGFAQTDQDELHKTVYDLQKQHYNLARKIDGSDAKGEVGEKDTPTLSFRISVASRGFYSNTYGPTAMHMESYDMAVALLNELVPQVDALAAATAKAISDSEALGLPVIID